MLAFPAIWYMPPPKDVSLDGYRIDRVIHYTNSVITIFFSLVVLCLVYFLIRYRDNGRRPAAYIRGDTVKTTLISIALGLLVFCSVDLVIEAMSFKDLKEAFWTFPKGKEVLRVEIMPQQFAWNFRYAGPDNKFGTADDIVPAQNQMHIPVNTPVAVQMAPFDVIHSFYLPNFRFKVDATPGMTTHFWFQAKEEGRFEIACAELCGNGHYRMRGFLTVESKEKFNQWLKDLQAEAEEYDDWDDWGDDSAAATDANQPPADWGWDWDQRQQ